MASSQVKPMKVTGYNSMGDTSHQNTASATDTDVSNRTGSEDMAVEPEYRIVLVGRAGCGKSTIGNLLLNAVKFNTKQGPEISGSKFHSEINKEHKLQIVDTFDVFSHGYPSDSTSKAEFRNKLKMEAPARIVTAFLFPIPVHERFTPGHYEISQKYLQLCSEQHSQNKILVLTHMNKAELSEEERKASRLQQVIDKFGKSVVRVPECPLKDEDQKIFIDEVMGHVRTMTYVEPPSRFGLLRDICASILMCLTFIWRQVLRLLRWVCRKCCFCPYCPRCERCGRCCCWCVCSEHTRLNP